MASSMASNIPEFTLTGVLPEIRHLILQAVLDIRPDGLHFNSFVWGPGGHLQAYFHLDTEQRPHTPVLRVCKLLNDEGSAILHSNVHKYLMKEGRVSIYNGGGLSKLDDSPFFTRYKEFILHLTISDMFDEFEDDFRQFTALKTVTFHYPALDRSYEELEEDSKDSILASNERDERLLEFFEDSMDEAGGHREFVDVSRGDWADLVDRAYPDERQHKIYGLWEFDVPEVGILGVTVDFNADTWRVCGKKWEIVWKDLDDKNDSSQHPGAADIDETGDEDTTGSGLIEDAGSAGNLVHVES